ncbi:cysteine hydrolase family protein [Pseudomonas gingeri]|uniref:Cysteine hydrolase family protein n=1 Tax=Pseudomonas gingeri TaxID=117681 RepID=A0A7Y8CN64_9PSED|nr:cysteine hydrolase family protein [Pseudomonas gingeri]NWA04511.1 cysteine hydrolase family protein [Pseudomonas gingeri]NWA17320.1 cysteine hydrolase family protein [Pseudomonas gingeri]NWA56342.1 cysteine hydrolase family protein [Pseudomonas gingeri]NWA98096.1 cysteine hydrolase family protein [Pseudomonas gingeri]NWB02536.1 cysteine hydrolase family protein [Pseudomonas gingeri]
MRQALLIIDVQPSFSPPPWLVDGIMDLIGRMPSVATVERHDESITPFQRQLGWHPAPDDDSLVPADRIFIKHGYAPSPATIAYLKGLEVERVLVCGLQTETCCLAAGFALFDAGLQPTLITDLTVGSSLDRSGGLGTRLWEHHFKHTVRSQDL